MSPAEHARACDCPGCSCVGVSRDYLRTMLEDDERRRRRRARRAHWARTLARVAVPVSIGAAIGAMIPTP